MGEVTISVAGRAYQVVCEDGEEDRLAAIAARVDHEAQAFGGATPSLSEPRLLLMCALLLADKLDEVETAPRATAPPTSAVSAEPAEVDTSAVDEATARIEALTQSGGSSVAIEDTSALSDEGSDAAIEAKADASPNTTDQTERPAKSSAAVAAEKDLLSWADRPESREDAPAEDDGAGAEHVTTDDIEPDPAPGSEVAEEEGSVESEAERSARERSERRKRRRERLARLVNENSDDA